MNYFLLPGKENIENFWRGNLINFKDEFNRIVKMKSFYIHHVLKFNFNFYVNECDQRS